jgi:hypothetical protein
MDVDKFNTLVRVICEDDLDRAKGALVIAYDDAIDQCRDRLIDHLQSAAYHKRSNPRFSECLDTGSSRDRES